MTVEVELDAGRCRELRDRLDWSQGKLALVAGLAERTVCDFESGLRAPRAGTLIALRRAFRNAGAGAMLELAQ